MDNAHVELTKTYTVRRVSHTRVYTLTAFNVLSSNVPFPQAQHGASAALLPRERKDTAV